MHHQTLPDDPPSERVHGEMPPPPAHPPTAGRRPTAGPSVRSALVGLAVGLAVAGIAALAVDTGDAPEMVPCGVTGAMCPAETARRSPAPPPTPTVRYPQQRPPAPRQPRCRTVQVPYGHGYGNAYTYETVCD
ncbi:hypothetical protein [Streptomyces sp. NPDC091371]|uniref:hypothetical protein n=1 Tax=Streptomyces sp. NPDC091371 TaxID=3155303 RepID=UPI00344543AD